MSFFRKVIAAALMVCMPAGGSFAQEMVFRISLNTNPNHVRNIALESFVTKLSERTKGKLDVQVFVWTSVKNMLDAQQLLLDVHILFFTFKQNILDVRHLFWTSETYCCTSKQFYGCPTNLLDVQQIFWSKDYRSDLE